MTFEFIETAQQELARTRIRHDVLLREAERLRDDAHQLEQIMDGSAARVALRGEAGCVVTGEARSYERMALRKFVEKTRGLLAVDALIERVEEDLVLLERSSAFLLKEVAR